MGDVMVITGAEEAKAAVGKHLGYSDWVEITQDRINQFADATGDHQWIHVDVERANAGPFGAPIAHGYLTLSMASMFLPTIVRVRGLEHGRELRRRQGALPVAGEGRLAHPRRG